MVIGKISRGGGKKRRGEEGDRTVKREREREGWERGGLTRKMFEEGKTDSISSSHSTAYHLSRQPQQLIYNYTSKLGGMKNE